MHILTYETEIIVKYLVIISIDAVITKTIIVKVCTLHTHTQAFVLVCV